jgi:hypothetical protein
MWTRRVSKNISKTKKQDHFSYFFIHIKLNAIRHFCPPDKLITVCNAVSPVIPKRPNSARYCSTVRPKRKTY